MLLASIFFFALIIGISVLGGLLASFLLRHMSAPAAKWKEVVIGLLMSGSTVAVVFYALAGGLQFEASAYGPTWPETVEVVAIAAPIWIGTFLLTRKGKH